MKYERIDDLIDLHNRLTLDYAGDKAFEQLEEDRLLTGDLIDKIEQGTLIELPCKVGDTVYVIASCNDVDMYRIYEENRCECPFEYDCDYEDCDAKGTTLRIFDTKVTGIYSTVGYKGFFVEFEYLSVQYQLEDFGEKFFLTREEAEKRLLELQGGKE